MEESSNSRCKSTHGLLMADGTERLGIQRPAKGVQREEKEPEASSSYTKQGQQTCHAARF